MKGGTVATGNQVVLGQIDHSEICANCHQFRGEHWGAAFDLCQQGKGKGTEYPRFKGLAKGAK